MMAEENKEAEDAEEEIQIEVYDDTPDEDKGRAKPEVKEDTDKAVKEDEDEDDDDDEADLDEEGQRVKYSRSVQKRIKQLKYEYHQERRQREEAERLREEAVKYSGQMNSRVKQLQDQMTRGESVLYSQAEGRVDAMIKTAQRELRDAYDAGDSEKIVEHQTALANLVGEKQRITQHKPRKSSPEQKVDVPVTAEPKTPDAAVNKPKPPSDRALDWSKKNDWFGKNSRMTAVAYAVHDEVIKSGVKPDSDEYYRQIDKEVRKTFPSHFTKDADEVVDTANVVAAPARTGGKKPRIVRLSKTQAAFCKRLGITPEQYAAEMLKEESKNG